jgi:nucleoside-diphosphate-sugar epimerase
MMSSINQTSKRILLIGGEGFIGRNLAAHFIRGNECFSLGQEPSIFLERGDTFVPGNPYQDSIENDYDVVVHLIDNKQCDAKDYVKEEQNLVNNIRLSSHNHLILFSSAVLYAAPTSPYGVRKALLEDFYTKYCEEKGVPLTIVRLFNTFGPFQIPYQQGSLIANLIWNALEGEETQINDMDAKRDFLYSQDIPRFVEYLVREGKTGVFDLGSGSLLSIGETIEILQEKVLEVPLKVLDKKNKESILPRSVHNPFLNIIPPTDIVEGLKETVDFYQHHKEIVEKLCR